MWIAALAIRQKSEKPLPHMVGLFPTSLNQQTKQFARPIGAADWQIVNYFTVLFIIS